MFDVSLCKLVQGLITTFAHTEKLPPPTAGQPYVKQDDHQSNLSPYAAYQEAQRIPERLPPLHHLYSP